MVEDVFPVRWVGGQAVVALPEHIGIANAGQIREELLSVINRGAVTLIADMTATVSCDNAGAEAVFRAFQRASASGTELRLVVTTRLVSRILAVAGLDRLVSIYPSVEAAAAASASWAALPASAAAAATTATEAIGRVPPGEDGPPLPGAVQDAEVLADGDVPRPSRVGEPAALVWDAAAAEREHREMLGAVISSIYRAGHSLQASLDLPADAAGQRVTSVLNDLDGIIRGIRDSVFAARMRAALAVSDTL